MALVYSYVRFSTRKQLEGDSLRRQVEDGEQWVRENGHTMADKELRDLGVSGFRGRNVETGALGAFLQDVKDGRVKPGSILLVENLDRLSRAGIKEARKVFEAILEAGVSVAVLRPYPQTFTLESVNLDPMALMAPLWSFHLAFLESKNKADRLRRLWDNKRKKSAEQGPAYKFDRKGPAWLDWNDDKKAFTPNKWAAAIQFIFTATAEGQGQRLVLAGLQAKFKGRRWNGSYVQKVLNDRAVLGERQPKTSNEKGDRVPVGAVIVGYYPAVVSEEIWHRAQGAKASNLKKKGPSGKFVNLFTGLVFNAHDGQPMHIQTTRGERAEGVHVQRRLTSYGHTSKAAGSDGVTVPYYDLERVLLTHLSEVRPDDLGSGVGVSELRAKEQELSGVEGRLKRIEADMAEADEAEYDTLRNAGRLVRAKRETLKGEVQKLKEELSADQPLTHAHDVLKMLADADDEQRHALRLRLRALVAELVAEVWLKPEKHYGRVWVLVQVVYRRGLVRQVGFGPGWCTTGSGRTECPEYGLDLRDRAACRKPKLGALAAMLCKPAAAPVVTKVPGKVGTAADLFLQVRRSQMKAESFRVVPSKVRRFVEFIGADTAVKAVGLKDWKLFVRTLRAEVTEAKLEKATARVCHNRVREFVQWLFDLGATPAFDLGVAP